MKRPSKRVVPKKVVDEMDGKKETPDVLQIKITLDGSQPPIWRTVLCKSDMNLEKFHGVIQDAMGWHDSHLHLFEVVDQSVGPRDLEYSDTTDEREVTLEDVRFGNATFWYDYDFGDSWGHHIYIEKDVPCDPKVSYPVCIAGERKCPPEDCGGIWGYQSMLDGLADGTISDYMREWLEEYTMGEPWNAEEFDLEKVNSRLRERRF